MSRTCMGSGQGQPIAEAGFILVSCEYLFWPSYVYLYLSMLYRYRVILSIFDYGLILFFHPDHYFVDVLLVILFSRS